jgi:hypothetical protein
VSAAVPELPQAVVPAKAPAPPAARPRFARPLHWAFVLVTLVAVAAVVGFILRQAGGAATRSDRPVAQARKGEFLVIVSCRGELVAGQSIVIAAPTKVPDLRVTWLAEQGSTVKAGDPIVRFDESGARRQLSEKEATLNQSQASLDQAEAEAGINVERDNLEIADARNAVEKARLDVSKAEIVSALQAAEYKLDLRLAEEKLRVKEAAARLNKASGESKVASLRSQRDKNKAEVDLTRERISRMVVTAPAAGLVAMMMNYSRGWVNAAPFRVGDNVWPGSTIAEIPDINTLQMKARLEEMDRGRITVGQAAKVVLDPFPEKPYSSKVMRVSPLVEQNFEWPPSRNFRAFASFDQVDQRLRPGMNGRLDVVVDRIPDAISVPAKAVFTRNGRPVVLIPAGDGLKAVEVAVVARNPDEVAVKGIEAGATVALIDELAEKKAGDKK